MAIKSAVSYIINEEQDGFVAVDFNFINGHDDEIRDWEFIDDCSSIDDKCDDDVDFTGSIQCDVSSEYLSDQIDVEDAKSVPESSPEIIVSHRQLTAVYGDVMTYQIGENDDEECSDLCENGEDSKSVPEYSPETIASNSQFDAVNAKSVQEVIASHRQFDDVIDDDVISYRTTGYYDYNYDCDYDRQEGEQDDYDLDDELVPYSAKYKLGRERMRKLGKRSCSKLVKSKRLTYNYNKAGCFRGKHGLGLKHI